MPLHRSILFWLGLFVLSFLLWAWADSRQNYTHWCPRSSVTHSLSIIHSAAALHVSRSVVTSAPAGPEAPPRILPLQRPLVRKSLRRSRQMDLPWFPAPLLESIHKPGGRPSFTSLGSGSASVPIYIVPDVQQTTLLIPHWVILLFYFPAWLALSYYYARRKKRSHPASLPPHPPRGSAHSDL